MISKTKLKVAIAGTGLVLGALIYTGCSKDVTTTEVAPAATALQREDGMVENVEEVKAKIEDFRQKIEAMKKGESVEMKLNNEEMVWNIEALLNATHGWGNFQYTKSSTETKKVLIGEQTEFSAADILHLYEESYSQLRDHYRKLEGEDVRQLSLVDIDIVTEKEGRFFTITSVYATSQANEAASRADDDWDAMNAQPWTNGLGLNCGKPSSPDAITNNINATRPVPPMHSYFTSIVLVDKKRGGLNPSGPIAGTQRREYLTYSSVGYTTPLGIPLGTPFFGCYSNDDHNWYIPNWKNLIAQNKPSNKYLSHCKVTEIGGVGTMPDGRKYHSGDHYGDFYYGTSVPMNACCPPPAY